MKHSALLQKLDLEFNDEKIFIQALRHRSSGKDSNERLEFLGDAALNLVIAAELFRRYPHITEGELSRLRSNLVNRDTLAKVAVKLDLGKYLEFGSGELYSGGAKRHSIIANAVESIIGAIYLDAGFSKTEIYVLRWFQDLLHKTTDKAQKDPKTSLQELLQLQKLPLPVYTVIKTSGAPHAQTFTVVCKVITCDEEITGEGSNKRIAERNAAQKMLEYLKNFKKLKSRNTETYE